MGNHSKTHPGVKCYLPEGGSTFCVRFKLNGKDARKGLGVTDAKIAEEHCQLIYDIQNGGDYDYQAVPEVIRKILNLRSPEDEKTARITDAIPAKPDDDTQDEYGFTQGEYDAKDKIIELTEEIEELERKLTQRDHDLAAVRAELAEYKAIAVASGREKLKKIDPELTVDTAVDNYLMTVHAHGTRAEYKSLLHALRDFLKKQGITKIQKVQPESILEFLNVRKQHVKYLPTLKKNCSIICACLDKATAGMFPVQLIKEWRKRNTKAVGKKDDEFFWIDEKQAKEISTHATSPFWKDVILVGYALGLRPKEIPLLQCSKVDLDRNQVTISPIFDGKGNCIRSLKTDKSSATLPFPTYVKSILKKRCQHGQLVLFPCNQQELGRKKKLFKKQKTKAKAAMNPQQLETVRTIETFELKHYLWNENAFFKAFTSELRAGAVRAKVVNDDKEALEKIDARLLRRSKGRELVLKQGPAKAAAYLRDDFATVARYYARYIPVDVKA